MNQIVKTKFKNIILIILQALWLIPVLTIFSPLLVPITAVLGVIESIKDELEKKYT